MMSYDENNIFAKILRGEIPSERFYENAFAIAIRDINPAAPVHLLAIPKVEAISFDDFMQKTSPEFVAGYFAFIQEVAAKAGLSEGGYRLITNHKEKAGQSVFHFHTHILGGAKLGALLG